MNDLVIGRALRALRHRLRMRQLDVARLADVSQQLISRIERGHLESVSHATLRLIFAVVEADVVTIVRWRGGDLDRLLDEGHAGIVSRLCDELRAHGWEVFPEVSFSIYGERGSIDILAWHPATRTLLVIEVKTEILSAEETLRRHDAKVRLAPQIAAERLGLQATSVSRLLVLPSGSTNRRRVARLSPMLDAVYPARTERVRAWLATPNGRLDGLLFTAVPARNGPRARRVRAAGSDGSGGPRTRGAHATSSRLAGVRRSAG
jgi:transcriptional regulator with XRE-family HTH domain